MSRSTRPAPIYQNQLDAVRRIQNQLIDGVAALLELLRHYGGLEASVRDVEHLLPLSKNRPLHILSMYEVKQLGLKLASDGHLIS